MSCPAPFPGSSGSSTSARRGRAPASPSACRPRRCAAPTRACGTCWPRWPPAASRTPSPRACTCARTRGVGRRYAVAPRAVSGGLRGGRGEVGAGRSLWGAVPSACPQLQNQSELRAPTAEKAAFYLDAALAARSTSRPGCSEGARCGSHTLFTLHVYQYRMEKCGRGGSRCPPGVAPVRRAVPGRGLGALGPCRHPPALWFQCLEAAAACISSTWAAVRGRPAGAARPPGAPRACLCRLWAASSWPWSAEPSTCPTGERRAPRWAGSGPGVAPGNQPRAGRACPVRLDP